MTRKRYKKQPKTENARRDGEREMLGDSTVREHSTGLAAALRPHWVTVRFQ